MEKIIASIITIGDELLIGQVVDTNSAWMGQELNKNGIWVAHRIAVGDVREDIWQALDEEFRRSQIILITGGLGPTADDITKPLLCEYFGGRLVVDPGALDNVKKIFARLQRPMIDRNLQQAEVPDTCTVIQNQRGTAPGMWFEKEGRIFVSMPGVPHEMKGMMTDSVIPNLRGRFRLPFIAHRTLLTAGIGESFLAEHIAAFETALPASIKLAYLPNYGMVRLRLTIHGEDPTALNTLLQENFDTLKGLVAEWMVADEDIAHLITSISGSSHYFKGSIVSYANEVKTNLLHVDPNILASEGAVSQATVEAMVRGALTQLDTDYVIATSGIMGPDGGTPEKPIGTVWVAVGNHQNILAQKFSFRFDRQRNIELTATNALNQLRKFILSAD